MRRHLQDYFHQPQVEIPSFLRKSLDFLMGNPFTSSLTASRIRKNVQEMAIRFIIAKDPQGALPQLRKIWDKGTAFTLDLLGESAVSDVEALTYQQRYLALLRDLGPVIQGWPSRDPDREREFPRINVSIKLSSLCSRMNLRDFRSTLEHLKDRLRPIFREARQIGAFVNIDMEHYGIKDLTLETFRSLLEEEEFRQGPRAGIVIQTYLKEYRQDLKGLFEWAEQQGRPITIRLVKGAYWDYEQIAARSNGTPVPVFLDKGETDAAFEEATRLCLERYPLVRTAVASHNVRSLAHAIVYAQSLGLPPYAYEIQMLYGMAEPIKKALQQLGVNVCEYTPIGDLLTGMAYLVRRLLENTSNESFLRQSFSEHIPIEELLRKPTRRKGQIEVTREGAQETPAGEGPPPFRREPLRGFLNPKAHSAFQRTLQAVESEEERRCPLLVGGKEIRTDRSIPSLNPARPSQVVGTVFLASHKEISSAVSSAASAACRWRETPLEERSHLLRKAAEILRSKRDQLAALLILEVSMGWNEADAEVCRAIDFLEYHAREILRKGNPRHLETFPGEMNIYVYGPLGVALVAAPWSSPLALAAELCGAALAAGNPVIFKPSGRAPVIGYELTHALLQAGIPEDVLHYLPFPWKELASAFLEDPLVSLIAFCSEPQGFLDLWREGIERCWARGIPKRLLTLSGGLNPILIDSDADLDEAIPGVVESAFGFQGQRLCSCSRVIVFEEVYDRFISRLVDTVRGLRVGDPADPVHHLGAVIDAETHNRIQQYVKKAKSHCHVLYRGEAPSGGYFVGPVLLEGMHPDPTLDREVIIGPILHILKARGMEEALQMANTPSPSPVGGIYSRNPGHIERAKRKFRVGGLFINRTITEAVVGRQPFGGFRMWGLGLPSGGPDTLLQFLQPSTLAENTVRRGFTPEMEGIGSA
jgi:RHH-type proline utilization regulon transcriptional repressor/proline dehydrogenase/delta 1-pyrroline-5-carboxylate dehydrogenase